MLKQTLSRLTIKPLHAVTILRNVHYEFSQPDLKKSNPDTKNRKIDNLPKKVPPSTIQQGYKLFQDGESQEIFDVIEERIRFKHQVDEQQKQEDFFDDVYSGLNLQRGINGVFDIEDLVCVLRKENAEDIFVCSVPKDLSYVDYMVVCSGRSYRHMLATANFVRRMFKIKRAKNDVMPKIEGEKSRDWMAMDLGNIALHIFSAQAREEYDLESLWAIGAEYDRETNKPKDPLVELFERHTFYKY